MAIVYVVQRRHTKQGDGSNKVHDYSAAERYGEIVYIVPAKNIVEEQYGGDTDKVISDRLKDFKPTDFLVLTGDPIFCAKALLEAVSRLENDISSINALKYEHDIDDYLPVEIPIPF